MRTAAREAINASERASAPGTEARAGLRLEVMRVVEANPRMSHSEIARELGVFLGGMNRAVWAFVQLTES